MSGKEWNNNQNAARLRAHNEFTEKVNNIALSASDDKRIKTRNGVISYSYDTGAERLCRTALIEYAKIKNLIYWFTLMILKEKTETSNHYYFLFIYLFIFDVCLEALTSNKWSAVGHPILA